MSHISCIDQICLNLFEFHNCFKIYVARQIYILIRFTPVTHMDGYLFEYMHILCISFGSWDICGGTDQFILA
jgi:hypothetical protein